MYLQIGVKNEEGDYLPDENPSVISVNFNQERLDNLRSIHEAVLALGDGCHAIQFNDHSGSWVQDDCSILSYVPSPAPKHNLSEIPYDEWSSRERSEDEDEEVFAPIIMEGCLLNVSKETFWFSGYMKNTNIEYKSTALQIKELLNELEIAINHESLNESLNEINVGQPLSPSRSQRF